MAPGNEKGKREVMYCYHKEWWTLTYYRFTGVVFWFYLVLFCLTSAGDPWVNTLKVFDLVVVPKESFSFTVWTCVLCNRWMRIRWMAYDLLGHWSAAHFYSIKISSPETLSTDFLKAVFLWRPCPCYEVVCQEQIAAIRI